ncbi:MAG: terminase gpA endonuclease subunit [Geobacteraceae bacterium]
MTHPTLAHTLPIIPIPDTLPGHIRRALSGRRVSFDIPRPVKLRMRHPEKIRVSEWAEKYRVVIDGAHEGPWRHEYAPHTVKIMDTFGFPWVREVWFCGVEQSGKTNTMINCIGWAVDCDPGNIFYLMPTEDTSDKVVGVKIRPTLQKSPRLARYLGRKQDDTTLTRINFTHGVTFFPAWANSPSSMATFTAKHCFGDEVDKYPVMAGMKSSESSQKAEADPITLIKKRNRNYKGRFKRFFASTPAGRYIQKGLQNCHQVWEYRVKCPDCGELIKMDAEHLIVPKDATPESIERDGCEYACACGSVWDDHKREIAIREGRWICAKGADISRPAKVGFHHRAWECLDIPLAEIASAWLKSKFGDLAAKIAWANGYEAEDYEAELSDRREDYILRLRDDRPEGLIPSAADIITLHADTQDNGFWYTVRAWEYGPLLNTWLVKAGFVETLDALTIIMKAEYQVSDGSQARISHACIDTQGHRTAEIYAWCKATGCMAFAGASGRKKIPVTVSKIEQFPGTSKPIPGGLSLYHLDTHYHKDALAIKLKTEPSDPGAWLLHSGYSTDQIAIGAHLPTAGINHGLDQYARHFCAEGRDESGRWQNPKRLPNHLWDCENYALALALYLKFDLRTSHKNEQAKPATAHNRQKNEKPRRW